MREFREFNYLWKNAGCYDPPRLMAGSGIDVIRTRHVDRCPACNGGSHPLYRNLADRAYGVPGAWTMQRCERCRAAWLSPAPIAEDLQQCYVGAYYTHEETVTRTLGATRVAAFIRSAVLSAHYQYRHLCSTPARIAGTLLGLLPPIRRRAAFSLGPLLLPFRSRGQLLEVGCGNGSYLALMRQLGWTVSGLEVDPAAADTSARSVGCPVHVGTMADANLPAGSCDAIVSRHVLEHVADPLAFVQEAARLLKPGAILALSAPNLSSLGHRLFGADWYSLDPPRHLCLFTPKALRGLLDRSGCFTNIHLSTATRHSRLVMERRSVKGSAFATRAFQVAEALGNSFCHWGEELIATATRI
jgi:2-polyprenyl-3-methyl-5-hydroxy-6-metoxy-1,4-benzoquinol methylase